jgi:hypothetical protein
VNDVELTAIAQRDALACIVNRWLLFSSGRAPMANLSSSIELGICRRSVLQSIPMIACAIISTNAVAQALTQTKLSHEAAKYQDNPKDGQQCSGCVQFVAPHSCKVVEDPVAASGWCQLFQAKPT